MNLTENVCRACEGGVEPLTREQVKPLLEQLHDAWTLSQDGRTIVRHMTFADFKELMAFVNQVADLAESEGHHPDLDTRYNKLTIALTTHAIGGLSENDFILAAKIDTLGG